MKLNKLIVHEIKKVEGQTKEATVESSDELLPINTESIEFIEELNKRYRNLRQTNGKFKDGKEEKFPLHFSEFIKDPTDLSFVEFSKKTIKNLQDKIIESAPAKGGYIVFADYQETQRMIGVFLIRNKKGNKLEKKANQKTFAINEAVHIDFEHLAMACRINHNLYSTNQSSFLTFINRINIDSQFFIRWICADQLINNVEDTRNLLKVLKAIELPKTEDGKEMDRGDFINEVYKEIKNTPKGENTDLKQIGLKFYDDENKLTDYAQDAEVVLNHSFKADNSILRYYVNIKAKADKIDLVFPQAYLDSEKIKINKEQNLILIESAELVDIINRERIS